MKFYQQYTSCSTHDALEAIVGSPGIDRKVRSPCALPVSEEQLEETNCASAEAYWATRSKNWDLPYNLVRSVKEAWFCNIRQQEEDLQRRKFWSSANPLVCLTKACLSEVRYYPEFAHYTVEEALLTVAEACAGCHCCERHKRIVFDEPCADIEDDLDQSNDCMCPCRFLFWEINEIFLVDEYWSYDLDDEDDDTDSYLTDCSLASPRSSPTPEEYDQYLEGLFRFNHGASFYDAFPYLRGID